MHDAPRREFYAKMDSANIDLKGFTEDFYVKLTGAHLQAILDTLAYVHHDTDCCFEEFHQPFGPRRIPILMQAHA
jgi:pyruvate formate lyase activating enzyme